MNPLHQRFCHWLTLILIADMAVRHAACAEPESDLLAAARRGDARAVAASLDKGVSVNARDELGNTPLMIAAVCAPVSVVEVLLKVGAAVNVTNKAGATPLMRAATDEAKVRLLLAREADVRVRSALGSGALIAAAGEAWEVSCVDLGGAGSIGCVD